jgi:hypothetical protein
MKLEILNDSTDYMTRLGSSQQPVLVKFTCFSVKLEVLKNT